MMLRISTEEYVDHVISCLARICRVAARCSSKCHTGLVLRNLSRKNEGSISIPLRPLTPNSQ